MTQLNVADFSQRYLHTYGRSKYDGKAEVTVFIEAIHGETQNEGLVHISSARHGSETLRYPACLNTLNLDQPTPGFFNCNNHAIYFFRYPDRQFSRGLANRNSEFYNPLQLLLPQAHNYRPLFGFSSVEHLFNRTLYTDVGQCVDMLNTTTTSIALTLKMMISLSPHGSTPYLLWWGCTPIGKWNKDKFQICDATFEQEVFDECRKYGINQRWMNF